MNRGIVFVCVVGAALASCKGAGGKKRVPDGEKASAAFLIRTIEAVRTVREHQAVLMLGEGVAEVCGKGCECLARAAQADAGDRGQALYECPSVCTPDARAKALAAPAGERLATLAMACTPEVIGLGAESAKQVGDDWLAVLVSGQYLADAYDAANADDRKAYQTAFEGFVVPLAPTAGMAGVAVPGAQNAGALGRSRTFVAIDAKGTLRAGTMHGARFTPTGAAYVPATLRDFPDADTLGKKLREARALGFPLEKVAAGDDALAKAPPQDDPPPPIDDPPPPEEPDDEDDESGGTGIAMATTEGKMGKKDSDRAEGQYKMKRNADDPQLARQQAIEAARKAGVLGSASLTEGGAFASLTGTGDVTSGFDDVDSHGGLLGEPLHRVVGLAGTPIDEQVVVFADRAAPATALLEVLSVVPDGAVLAAEREGRLVALPLAFTSGFGFASSPAYGEPTAALTLDVGTDTILVGSAALGEQTEVSAGDAAALQAAIKARLDEPAFADRGSVTVTPRDDATVAQVVAAFDAALSAGARTVAFESSARVGTGWGTIGTGRYGTIGGTIGGGQVGPRGTAPAGPSVSLGQPNAAGDLDKAIIRRYIKRNLPKITYCYEKALLTKPSLAGTVTAKFFIAPNGSVASSEASGVDPTVASCVAQVIKGIEFPKPKGGGGVQVNYPFTFRSAQK